MFNSIYGIESKVDVFSSVLIVYFFDYFNFRCTSNHAQVYVCIYMDMYAYTSTCV